MAEIDKGDEAFVVSRVWKIKKNLDAKLAEIQEQIFQRTEISRSIIRVQKIALSTGLAQFQNRTEPASEPVPAADDNFAVAPAAGGVHLPHSQPAAEEPCGTAKDTPAILSADAQKRLDSFITRHKLVKTGHFYMGGAWCARDWVDTTKFLEDPELIDTCVQHIAQHIKKNYSLENTAIGGIDLNGTLMGARIAAEL